MRLIKVLNQFKYNEQKHYTVPYIANQKNHKKVKKHIDIHKLIRIVTRVPL